jgi:tRNA(Arg) A34 adenosine deaminase TadA
MTATSYMQRAIDIALDKMRANEGGPFGAVVVRNGEIIAEGWNQVTSGNDPTAHAEVVAIRAACTKLGTFDLSDCEMFASCEPCPMCLGAIYWARFRRLYYGNTRQEAAKIGFDDEFIYREVALDPSARSIPTQQLKTSDSDKPFAEWMTKPDKVAY